MARRAKRSEKSLTFPSPRLWAYFIFCIEDRKKWNAIVEQAPLEWQPLIRLTVRELARKRRFYRYMFKTKINRIKERYNADE